MLPTARLLASRYRVLLPDLPGFGRSGLPSRALDISELATYLLDWLVTQGISNAVFLGNSLGCQVIVDLAARRPDVVQAAILVGPTIDPQAPSVLAQLARGARDLLHEPWSLLPILLADYLITGTGRMLRTLRFAIDDPLVQKLPRVEAPTLIVRGQHDTIVPQRWIEQIVRLLPHGRWEVIAGATHAANYSAPEQLRDLVIDFVRDEAECPAPP